MIKTLFDEHQLFRRGIMLLLIGLTGWVTWCSHVYAMAALHHTIAWEGQVAIIAGLQAPIIGLTGYGFKLYLKSRDATL